jgi:hypothetical protein
MLLKEMGIQTFLQRNAEREEMRYAKVKKQHQTRSSGKN